MMFGAPRKRTSPGRARNATLPAPIGGLNSGSPAMGMPATDAMVLYNMVAGEYGLRARLGSREHARGLTGASDDRVRSILPYQGSTSTESRVFATTSLGIWNVTETGGVAAAWIAATAYVAGDHVEAASTVYVCKVGGTSHASNPLPSVWVTLTGYTSGDRVINGSNVYICTGTGTSGATGPTGDGTGIVDDTCTWDYESEASSTSDGTVTWRHVPNNTEPTLLWSFSSSAGRAGHGVAHAQTTLGGNFLLYCDEENGLHVYTESTQTWTAVAQGADPATQISGVDPASFRFVTVYKGFAMYAVADSSDIWFTEVGAVYGAASRLGIGYKLASGGEIVGLWSWTYDGGSGLDDSLVAVSRGGDVVVFQGSDPGDATSFGIQGVWGVGKMPAGRDLASPNGGDLLLLTRMGVLPMSRLVKGQDTSAIEYETAKVQSLFASLVESYADVNGWSLRLHPEEGTLYVMVPTGADLPTTQLAMSTVTKSWSQLRGLDIFSCASHGGKLYFGDTSGSVHINDGYTDGNPLADPTDGTAVQFSGVSAFQNMATGAKKQIHLIRPYFLGQSANASFSAGARYDFDMTELSPVVFAGGAGNTWGSGVWDTSLWGGALSPTKAVRGASGMGANVAIAWRGASVDRTVLTGFEVSFSVGGML